MPDWRTRFNGGRSRLRLSATAWILLLLTAFTAANTRAQDHPAFRFDIMRSADSVLVWLDLSPLLNAANVDRMKDGLELAIECDLSMVRPKRLFGAVEMASMDRTFEVSYQILTEQYFFRSPDSTFSEKIFPSQSGLFDYLADSVLLPLASLDSLSREDRYELEVSITAISLGNKSLGDSGSTGGAGGSPLRWLYLQMLKVTGYGRTEYSFRSRPFGLSELYLLR